MSAPSPQEGGQDIRAVLFRQIEIAEHLARKLDMPELIQLLDSLDLEAHQVFQAKKCIASGASLLHHPQKL